MRAIAVRFKLLVGALGVCLVALVLTAPAANAWPFSHTVHVAGHASCTKIGMHPSALMMWGAPGGQNESVSTDKFGWFDTYGVNVQHVTGTNKMWVYVHCKGQYFPEYSYWRSFDIHPTNWPQLNQNFSG